MPDSHFLHFNPADNPAQLSKIGNWLITYLSPQDENQAIVLAISYVLPIQMTLDLQPRQICIAKTQNENEWRIESIECFDSQTSKNYCIDLNSSEALTILHRLMSEFERYDVELELF